MNVGNGGPISDGLEGLQSNETLDFADADESDRGVVPMDTSSTIQNLNAEGNGEASDEGDGAVKDAVDEHRSEPLHIAPNLSSSESTYENWATLSLEPMLLKAPFGLTRTPMREKPPHTLPHASSTSRSSRKRFSTEPP